MLFTAGTDGVLGFFEIKDKDMKSNKKETA
jgi:hypothetical protein